MKKAALILALTITCLVGCFYKAADYLNGLLHQQDVNSELWLAVHEKRPGQVESLLANGADPNYNGDPGAGDRNVLIEAADSGNARIIHLLLRKGADPSKALYSVTDAKQAAEMLNLGADPNLPLSSNRMTALMDHASLANADVVGFLLKHGADPNLTDSLGKSALECAEYAGGNHPERTREYVAVYTLLNPVTRKRHQ